MIGIGDKVHYIPFPDCDDSIKENGIVKSIQDTKHCFVVYHWDKRPEEYQNFTGQRTKISELKKGWV
jgi:hypothetical protein